MALRLLRDGESTRMTGRIFWMEDLERAGLTVTEVCAMEDWRSITAKRRSCV